jgi:DNA-binding response OmpR family regulator
LKILIVDDEPDVRALVRSSLSLAQQSLIPIEAADGDEALAMIYSQRPDLVVLDLALPRRDGFSVLEQVREKTDLPIIVLTARGLEEDKLRGLRLGADDYLTKPFSPRELVARVRAVLRRAEPAPPEGPVLEVGELRVDLQRRRATLAGSVLVLRTLEFELLAELTRNPGHVVTRDRLLDRVWGVSFAGGTRTVDVHVAQLRKKLGRPGLIQTVRGVGYRLQPT